MCSSMSNDGHEKYVLLCQWSVFVDRSSGGLPILQGGDLQLVIFEWFGLDIDLDWFSYVN